MTPNQLKKAGLLAMALAIIFIGCWELYLRSTGADNAFDDLAPIWANARAKIYGPPESKTVFIGSSRIKFDLDIPTWENITGSEAIQLALQGSTPVPLLHDLANDTAFKGRLIIDVTEGLFFSPRGGNWERPNGNIKYYHDLSPTQRASFAINKPLESSFVFLDKENYSINALLDKLRIPSRPGVFVFPVFPRDFDRNSFDCQSYMTPAFVADSAQHNEVKAIWAYFASFRRGGPISGGELDSFLLTIKASTDKIKARGGEIIFVRTPSSGGMWMGEQKGFPREQYWDKILTVTETPGIYFMDDEATNHYICPEFSHLTPSDAVDYTKHLIRILSEKHQWKFPKMQSM